MHARLQLQRGDFALDVDLQLPERGVTAVFGPSGCGKTTLLRALAGLERAAGRVALAGSVWQDDASGVFLPPHRRPLGYVIQESALFPHLSVDGNLRYGQRRSGAEAARVDLAAVIALLDIAPLLPRRPATLSGGERQRVAIARALATGPQLLLMDEPLAALDAPRKAEILPYLERLQRSLSMPIVYVTHAMDEVARLADHGVQLQAGKVLATGPLTELLARPDLAADDAGAVLDATVLEHDGAYALSRIGFTGGALWLGRVPAAVGERVRVRVPARDVSLVRHPPAESSILNVLPVVVEALHDVGATTMVGLLCDGAGEPGLRLLARITRKSRDALALQVGDRLFAQVKGVSLM